MVRVARWCDHASTTKGGFFRCSLLLLGVAGGRLSIDAASHRPRPRPLSRESCRDGGLARWLGVWRDRSRGVWHASKVFFGLGASFAASSLAVAPRASGAVRGLLPRLLHAHPFIHLVQLDRPQQRVRFDPMSNAHVPLNQFVPLQHHTHAPATAPTDNEGESFNASPTAA